METVPLWALLLALCVLILLSAFFSMTETALMAANRHRLRHLAKQGNRRAITILWLLDRTERLLSLVLIANTAINALATALVTAIAIATFGNHQRVVTAATLGVAALLIIFAEIVPKVIGATYPERISLFTGLILKPLLRVSKPLIWFVNIFVSGVLKLLRIKSGARAAEQRISPDELRSIVLDGGSFIPQKHKSILLNLFDLEKISVEDVMTPRAQVEALNLDAPIDDILHQLATCYHNKLPVFEGEINRVAGILHVRRAISLFTHEHEVTHDDIRALLAEPYYVPVDTDVFTQLAYFQENHERLGIVVDEYGEVQGLVTLEDIIEEMIGEFTTSSPGSSDGFSWDKDGSCLLEGSTTLRDINKRLGLQFPLDGPKTLNGLLLEYLQDIPEANVAMKIAGCIIEIVHVQNQSIRMVKLIAPGAGTVLVIA